MMRSKYPQENPYSFYDPEQDWEGLREGPPRHRSAPVSPQGPISPRASPHGTYPPEFDHGYNRSRLPDSTHKQPFGAYDLEQDLHERPKQRGGAPFRPSEEELGYYNPSLQNLKELDTHGRVAESGVPLPPIYVNPNVENLLAPQASPPIGRYGPKAPSNDSFGQRNPPSEGYGQGAPLNDGYGRGAPLNDGYGRGAPLNDGYGQRASPNDSYRRGAPPNDSYARGTPPNDRFAQGAPPDDIYGRGAPPIENYARRVSLNESYAQGAPPNDTDVSRALAHGAYDHEAPPNATHGPKSPTDGACDHEAPPNATHGPRAPTDGAYDHEAPPNRRYEQKFLPNDTYGRGSLESAHIEGGVSKRASTTLGNNYDAIASGASPHYGEESSGYRRGLGGGQGVVPLGNGRYEYGGLHQLERLDMVEDYNGRASTPAPISSEYAHQVYASVFSDPVYGGAHQLNSQAGYQEEPDSLRQAHYEEDVLRHPNGF